LGSSAQIGFQGLTGLGIGLGTCPSGSATPNSTYSSAGVSLCIQDTIWDGEWFHFLYGGYTTQLLALCHQKGGGLMCATNRWQGDFYLFLIQLLAGAPSIHCSTDNSTFECDGQPPVIIVILFFTLLSLLFGPYSELGYSPVSRISLPVLA